MPGSMVSMSDIQSSSPGDRIQLAMTDAKNKVGRGDGPPGHSPRSKIGLLFTHRNGPILRAKLNLYDLQCSLAAKKGASPSERKLYKN